MNFRAPRAAGIWHLALSICLISFLNLLSVDVLAVCVKNLRDAPEAASETVIFNFYTLRSTDYSTQPISLAELTVEPRSLSNSTPVTAPEYCSSLGFPDDHVVWVQATTDNWQCVKEIEAGGTIKVFQQEREKLNWNDSVSTQDPPPDLYCVVSRADGSPHSDSRPTGYGEDLEFDIESFYPANRKLRFLATADAQYDSDEHAIIQIENADQVLLNMRQEVAEPGTLPSTSSAIPPRGIIIAGDNTQNGQISPINEIQMYRNALGAIDNNFISQEHVFDGLGNHDPAEEIELGFASLRRNTVLTGRQGIHYSWDWHDVHFVYLNLFPGVAPDGNKDNLNPDNSLGFLANDLALNVGNSKRPVVLIHHYGFDPLSIGNRNNQLWWTEQQRNDYMNTIQPYNVVAIFSGHEHYEAGRDSVLVRDSERTINYPDRQANTSGDLWNIGWAMEISDCGVDIVTDLPNTCWNFIAGSASGANPRPDESYSHGVTHDLSATHHTLLEQFNRRGAYLDVTIDSCNIMTVIRRDKFGDEQNRVTLNISAPGRDCTNTLPTVSAGGPYTAVEGSPLVLSGEVSDNDNWESRWIIDGIASAWAANNSEITTTLDDDYAGVVTLEVRETGLGYPVKTVSTTTGLVVNNLAPTIGDLDNLRVSQGDIFSIAPVITDPGNNDTHSLQLDLGDGNAITITNYVGDAIRLQYDEPGTYTVEVTVTDDNGGRASRFFNIVVSIAADDDAGKKGGGSLDLMLIWILMVLRSLVALIANSGRTNCGR